VFGGKLTVCAVTYGNYPLLLERFLRHLFDSTTGEMFSLRLGLNAPSEASREIAEGYAQRHSNIDLTISSANLFKNPMMRRLLYDNPITTEWTAWFDDDSYVKRSDWLLRLALKIQREPRVDVWGSRYLLFPDETALQFVRTGPTYRGLPWLLRHNESGEEVPCFEFATGGFWVARTRVLQALEWPDPRVVQAGEDFLFGEALRQNGFQIGSFDRCVAVSAAERRNASATEVARIPEVNPAETLKHPVASVLSFAT
jgi:GT2 family glycosyltransferase